MEREGTIKEENSVTIHNPPEQTEESSKAFMESIGSWINDLFNAPNKVLDPAIKPEKVVPELEMVLEHAEYIKLLIAIKKRYQKKLKHETSVHLTASDKPFDLYFENSLKSVKKKKSQFSSETPKPLNNVQTAEDDFSEILKILEQREDSNLSGEGLDLNHKDDVEDFSPTEDTRNFINLLTKDKKKQKNRRIKKKGLGECILPTPADLSNRILQNAKDQNKGLQLLNNLNISAQESQQYGQGRKRTCQVNARCYTTNANPKENVDNSSKKNTQKCLQYCMSKALKMKGVEEVLNRNSMDIKKYIAYKSMNVSDPQKDSMTFSKTKNTKSLPNSQTETSKNQSEDLVKYLVKKIKTNPPLNHMKKKSNLTKVEIPISDLQKNKIKRSATNCLVMRIAAKSDHQTSLRNDCRALPENKLLGNNEVHVKFPENMRFDVSRAVNPKKFNKCSYLAEREKCDDDRYLPEKHTFRSSRRNNDFYSKRNDKKPNEEYKKDYLSTSSKMDMSSIVFQKPKQKEVKKDLLQLESSEGVESSEVQMARFKKQHELFRTTFKKPILPLDTEIHPPEAKTEVETETETETETEKQADSSSNINLLPAEFVDSKTTLQLATEEKDEIMKTTPLTPVIVAPKEPEIVDLSIEKKPLNVKIENKIPEKLPSAKKKGHKIKSALLLNDNSQIIFNGIRDIHNVENKNQKDSTRGFEPSVCSADTRTPKTGENTLFNRRYSTKTLMETTNKQLSLQPNETNSCLPGTCENTSGEKAKDKKEKTQKSESQELESCGIKTVAKKLQSNYEEEK